MSRHNEKSDSMRLSQIIKKSAFQLGFDFVSVGSALPLENEEARYRKWCEKSYAGDLSYMKKEYPRRWVPGDLLPEVKSVITFAVNFFSGITKVEPKRGFGRVARYAWGKDYHSVIRERLEMWVKLLPDLADQSVKAKIFVDSGPLLEKAFANRSGTGFVGKNTLIINRKLGSSIFLSEVLTDLELPADEIDSKIPLQKDECGSCEKCMKNCPTGALVFPRQLDVRRCISYWTMENRGTIPEEIRPQIGDWIFGCDICQEVCPYTGLRKKTKWKELLPQSGAGPYVSLLEVMSIKTDEEFGKKFSGMPILRAKRAGLVRNACIVAANQKFEDAIPLLKNLAESDSEPVIRSHALWSLNQIRPV